MHNVINVILATGSQVEDWKRNPWTWKWDSCVHCAACKLPTRRLVGSVYSVSCLNSGRPRNCDVSY